MGDWKELYIRFNIEIDWTVRFCFKELFFLGLGVILFGIVGALSMASIESVPEDLVDNAAVFGALCILTALVFIADLLMSSPKKKISHNMTEALSGKAGNSKSLALHEYSMNRFSNCFPVF